MNDLMIDLETMGKSPKAPVVAIGAVFFEPTTGDLGPRFYTAVNLASELSVGAVPDGDTINWWLKQSSEARAAITSEEATPIAEALDALTNFVTRSCEQPKYLKVWGNGAAFDGYSEKPVDLPFWRLAYISSPATKKGVDSLIPWR